MKRTITDASGDPTILLLSNGLVDVKGNNIPELELMVNAFLNSVHLSDGMDAMEHYGYRQGNKFINKYTRTKPGMTQ